MPAASKGARLYFRAASGKQKAVWVIRDGDGFKSTGFGADEREKAEQRLAEYIVEKHKPSRDGGRHPSEILVADVVSIYLEDKAPGTARPKEVGQRMVKVLEFFGKKTLIQINSPLCAAYVRKRKSKAAARRELEDLRSAIRYHWDELGLCLYETRVSLPDRPAARERWLTRDEAARLLWVALGWSLRWGVDRYGEPALVLDQRNKQNKLKRRHLARFTLVGLYTGTRSAAICQASFTPTEGRGHIDLARGVFRRRQIGVDETNKKRPPIRLHERLLAHLRRWQRLKLCREAVVEWKGRPITRMAKSFRNAASDAGFDDVTPHILRHTAITWAMQNGADKYETSGFFGVSLKVLEDVYAHHHPEEGAGVNKAIGGKARAQSVRYAVRQT